MLLLFVPYANIEGLMSYPAVSHLCVHLYLQSVQKTTTPVYLMSVRWAGAHPSMHWGKAGFSYCRSHIVVLLYRHFCRASVFCSSTFKDVAGTSSPPVTPPPSPTGVGCLLAFLPMCSTSLCSTSCLYALYISDLTERLCVRSPPLVVSSLLSSTQ